MREDAQTKARRYLTEGRLHTVEVAAETIGALCRGDGEIHRLGWNTVDDWTCSCKAMTTRCAHLLALRLVCVATRPRTEATP